MQLLDAIQQRRSIRDYHPKLPSNALIEAVIMDAIHAPNSMNRQAWSFLVIRGRTRLARYSQEAIAALGASIPAALRGLVASPGFNIFYNAPALILICATQRDPMVAHDCCLAAQTLMLAAPERGLGTCWIGFAEAWLATPQARQELGIANDQLPIAPIIIGYPQTIPPPTPRQQPAIRWLGEAEG